MKYKQISQDICRSNINPQTVSHNARKRQMFAYGGFIYCKCHKPQNVLV